MVDSFFAVGANAVVVTEDALVSNAKYAVLIFAASADHSMVYELGDIVVLP